jgi:hypothetical protein
VKARLFIGTGKDRQFDATLSTANISVGGMFVESSFFLKPGTKVDVELTLPPHQRQIRVKAKVLRVETPAKGRSGFGLQFTEYLEESELVLASYFLEPVVREFIHDYATRHRIKPTPEYIAHAADLLAAWELRRDEAGDVWAVAVPPPKGGGRR